MEWLHSPRARSPFPSGLGASTQDVPTQGRSNARPVISPLAFRVSLALLPSPICHPWGPGDDSTSVHSVLLLPHTLTPLGCLELHLGTAHRTSEHPVVTDDPHPEIPTSHTNPQSVLFE